MFKILFFPHRWRCDTCMSDNDFSLPKCAACTADKPASAAPVAANPTFGAAPASTSAPATATSTSALAKPAATTTTTTAVTAAALRMVFYFYFIICLQKIKQNNVICSQLWSSRSQLWSSRSRLWSSCNQLWSSCGSQESCRCKHSRPSRRCSCHNNGRVNSCFCRLRFRRRRHRRRHRDPGRRYKAGGCGGRERNPGCKDC